jgi:AcrR family transcriptional regulator
MNAIKRLRRPSAGGYARGAETRVRIIEAAIELFDKYGFEGATTRGIAARAGVNTPALQYYFESKEGVCRACAEYVADNAWAIFGPIVHLATEMLRKDGDTQVLIDAFIRIQGAVAGRMLAKGCALSQQLFFAREQTAQGPSIASEVLKRRICQPLNDVGMELVARITDTAVDDPITMTRMLCLQGQLLIFYAAPSATSALLGWEVIDAEQGELVKAVVHAQTRVLLETWSKERPKRVSNANH